MPFRLKIWEMLNKTAGDFPEEAYTVVSLDELDDEIEKILAGNQVGRTVLQHKV